MSTRTVVRLVLTALLTTLGLLIALWLLYQLRSRETARSRAPHPRPTRRRKRSDLQA